MPHQDLSFQLSPARSQTDLRAACAVRAQAYGHHLPALQQAFGEPDALDAQAGTCVLLCRDKQSGEALGTARIQASAYGPLQIERSVSLPGRLAQQSRAEITRLAVSAGAPSEVRLALMKASYLHCLAHEIDWLVIGARHPGLVRMYRKLGFHDVPGTGDGVPLAHAGDMVHRILAFDVAGALAAWQAADHPLLDFMVHTQHPDIAVDAPLPMAA
jgi:hypothetical protein